MLSTHFNQEFFSANLSNFKKDFGIGKNSKKNTKVFALVDCNNFYASCERAFNPALRDKPVVILSNNDGCIIARSNEAKALGIEMGAPFFKYRDFIKRNKVAVFSSNYQLYGDMSKRVMNSLKTFCGDIEIYSIDEAFLRLDKMSILRPKNGEDNFFNHDLLDQKNYDNGNQEICDYEKYAQEICKKVVKWTSIPISIGLAPTKTLAKLANQIAKNNPNLGGVFYINDAKDFSEFFKKTKIGEIWGIGVNSEKRLNKINIFTIEDFINADQKLIQKILGVVGEKIFLELHGISCLDIQDVTARKQIVVSRSFGQKQTQFEPIAEAVANYVNQACTKLRAQKSRARGLCVYVRTHFYLLKESYSNSISIGFEEAQSDSRIIAVKARECLKKIFKSGFRYHKAGVILFDICDETSQQADFLAKDDHQKNDDLMQLIDKINNINKSQTLFFASQGIKRDWQMKKDLRSPVYTRWEGMLHVG